MAHDYIALLEAEPEGGYTVTFPEIGIAATYGANREEALAQAEDMLEEAVLGMMAHGDDVPPPARARIRGMRATVLLPPLTAAKLEAYRAVRAALHHKKQLAERLGWQPSRARRPCQ